MCRAGSARPLLGPFYSRRLNGSAALLYDGRLISGRHTSTATRLAPNLSTHAQVRGFAKARINFPSSSTSHLFLPHRPILVIGLLACCTPWTPWLRPPFDPPKWRIDASCSRQGSEKLALLLRTACTAAKDNASSSVNPTRLHVVLRHALIYPQPSTPHLEISFNIYMISFHSPSCYYILQPVSLIQVHYI